MKLRNLGILSRRSSLSGRRLLLNSFTVAACLLLSSVGFGQTAPADRDLKVASPVADPPKHPQVVRPLERQQFSQRGMPSVAAAVPAPESRASSSAAPDSTPRSARAQPSSRGAGADNTLRVSGWWTIDVKNADGSTALHREVENTFNVTPMIVNLLAGRVVAGEPAIRFGAGDGNTSDAGDPTQFTNSPCAGTNGCLMSEVAGGYWNSLPQCSQNRGSCSSNVVPSVTTVTVEIDTDCGLGGCVPFNSTVPALELNGQITAQINSSIAYLETDWYSCSESTNTSQVTGLNPASCIAGGTGTLSLVNMTHVYLGNPVSISAGQVILIKVDISFSPFPS